ncbi:hypothetical protein M0R04_16670 [Candidatus Dojkabacteria bacterium]|jgi:hypothetical protein|nr:hypothetical protein [Candidatus Dojkabacteria bacterium]
MGIISKSKELLEKYKGNVSSAVNYFNPTSNNGNNFWSGTGGQGLANLQRNVQQIPQQINNTISSIPYKMADRRIQNVAQNKIPVDWSNPVARQQGIDKVMANAPRWGRSFVPQSLTNIGGSVARNPDSWTGSLNPVGQMQDFSNPLQRTYNAPQITPSPLLENIKRNVISGLKPSAREFLSNVPIQFGDIEAGGESRNKGTPGRNITINENLIKNEKDPNRKMVIDEITNIVKHELLHQTPRLVPTEMFHPKNKPVIDEYTNRWGTEYMKQRPTALVEEMFAEEALPPAYYWHIFKNVNPNATKKNFIDTMKYYFVNNINTDVPQTQQGIAPMVTNAVKGRTLKK